MRYLLHVVTVSFVVLAVYAIASAPPGRAGGRRAIEAGSTVTAAPAPMTGVPN